MSKNICDKEEDKEEDKYGKRRGKGGLGLECRMGRGEWNLLVCTSLIDGLYTWLRSDLAFHIFVVFELNFKNQEEITVVRR